MQARADARKAEEALASQNERMVRKQSCPQTQGSCELVRCRPRFRSVPSRPWLLRAGFLALRLMLVLAPIARHGAASGDVFQALCTDCAPRGNQRRCMPGAAALQRSGTSSSAESSPTSGIVGASDRLWRLGESVTRLGSIYKTCFACKAQAIAECSTSNAVQRYCSSALATHRCELCRYFAAPAPAASTSLCRLHKHCAARDASRRAAQRTAAMGKPRSSALPKCAPSSAP